MKYTIFLLFFLQTSFGQSNLEINYIIKYDTEIYNEKKGTLLLDLKKKKSIFFISKNNLKKEVAQEVNQVDVIQSGIERFIAADVNSNLLICKEKINSDTYIVSENIPKINWKLEDEITKKIDKYTCYKATANFRGRNYIVWYSLDYPIQMGPWKFNGLPGLIMEIYDETNRYYWGVTQIKFTNDEVVFPRELELYEKIDLKKYVELRYDNIMEDSNARLPRGSTVQSIKPERNGLEIKFEWEK